MRGPGPSAFSVTRWRAEPSGEVIVYETPEGEARVDVRLERETV